MQVYTPPKPAPLPADFEEFFATLQWGFGVAIVKWE
jgi:hypothetical protein